jgi:DNA-binding IclR family transcriptional regulator
MALEDLAKLIAPRAQSQVLSILRAFYPDNHPLTKDELLRATRLHPKMFEYLLTRMRHYRLIWGEKIQGQHRYYLDPNAFHTRIDTLFVDPVKHLVKGKR